jgi:photosystem II stability/assembly factor-like uncharacterized protein
MSRPGESAVTLRPINAVIHEVEDPIQAQQTRITSASAGQFTQAVFVNERRGWGSTNKLLYGTADGGLKWSRLAFTAGEDSRISSFTFIDEARGWLAVTKQIYTERYGLGNSSQIWSTNDGGNSWNKQADFLNEVRIKQIKFVNAENGFAIGGRAIDRPPSQGPAYDEILVLQTTDGGRVWTDISEGAKTEIKKQSGTTADHGWDIESPLSTDMFMLTKNAAVIQSSDRGKTWKTIAIFKDERPEGFVSSVGYYKLVFDTEQRLRIIAGAHGDEGYWGNLITRGEDNAWMSYELRLRPIYDAIFLSKDEVVACGEERRTSNDKRTPAVVGTILHSVDGGKSWTLLYRSKAKESFISLIQFNDRKFYAVSDGGTLLKFALP